MLFLDVSAEGALQASTVTHCISHQALANLPFPPFKQRAESDICLFIHVFMFVREPPTIYFPVLRTPYNMEYGPQRDKQLQMPIQH